MSNYSQEETAERKRERKVYRYLLSFTDLGLDPGDSISKLLNSKDAGKNSKPNETYISIQWGDHDPTSGINRTYIRRILRHVYGEDLYGKSEKESESWPGLTITKLVHILSSLENYWKNPLNSTKTKNGQPPKVIHSVKIQALQMFSELSSEERNKLNISMPAGEGLVKKIYEDILNKSYSFRNEELVDIYKMLLISKTIYHGGEAGGEELETTIRYHLEGLTMTNVVDEELVQKILKEVNRIEFQSGVEQVKTLLPSIYDKNAQIASIKNKKFIGHLTKCILENRELTDEFPISIEFFEIEKVKPLPLNNPEELMNYGLIKYHTASGLENQYSYKLKIHFTIKDADNKKLDFSEEVIGIGSPSSYINVALDRILLWDIPSLRDYYPIARQNFSNDEVMGEARNIWSHCAVQLYKRIDVFETIDKKRLLNPNAISHYGEYCGFDAFETSAKAALIARLRSIKYILETKNITPKEYIKEVIFKLEEYKNLRTAKSFLQYYPFSLGKMKNFIDKNIFENSEGERKYRKVDDKGNFKDIDKKGNFCVKDGVKQWSSVAYDAHLKIIEALLKEGRIVVSEKYLCILQSHEENLSAMMRARYHFCWSQYFFLSEFKDKSSKRKDISTLDFHLNEAEKFLKRRLEKCNLLEGLSHSNTHPYFEIHSKISMMKARVYLYFASMYQDMIYTKPTFIGLWEKAKAPLIEAETARLYSARDGNTSLYCIQSCFSAWVYIILAFTWDFTSENKEGFSKETCELCAQKLLNNAITCYEEIGVKCYAEIKSNAGTSDTDEILSAIPFIQEQHMQRDEFINKCENLLPANPEHKSSEIKILSLDLELLKEKESSNSQSKNISKPMLFGTDASKIIFIKAMLELCLTKEEDKILTSVRKATRKFVIAWSTSRDGTYKIEKDNGTTIERIFSDDLSINLIINENEYKTIGKLEKDTELLKKIDPKTDRIIRGFYPYRVSITAVLGKLFIGVCLAIQQCIDSDSQKKITWKEIHHLIEGLNESDVSEDLPPYSKQDGFNMHLNSHIQEIQKYFKSLEEKHIISRCELLGECKLSSKCKSLKKCPGLTKMQIRDKVVKDIFLIIKGEEAMS